MKVTEAFGMIFFAIFLVLFISAGTIAGIVESEMLAGWQTFLLSSGVFVFAIAIIFYLLCIVRSWRSDNE